MSYGLSCSDRSLNIFPANVHIASYSTYETGRPKTGLWSADVHSVTYDVLRLIFLTFIDEGRPVERPEWLGCSFVHSRTLRTEVFSQKVLKALLARHMDQHSVKSSSYRFLTIFSFHTDWKFKGWLHLSALVSILSARCRRALEKKRGEFVKVSGERQDLQWTRVYLVIITFSVSKNS